MKRIYRLENCEGLGPFHGQQCCVDNLVEHYDPEDLFKVMGYPKAALDALSAAGFVFGWKTQRHYHQYFKPGGQKACEQLGFCRVSYTSNMRLDLPDGQVMFLKEQRRDNSLREILSTLLRALSSKGSELGFSQRRKILAALNR